MKSQSYYLRYIDLLVYALKRNPNVPNLDNSNLLVKIFVNRKENIRHLLILFPLFKDLQLSLSFLKICQLLRYFIQGAFFCIKEVVGCEIARQLECFLNRQGLHKELLH